MEQNKEANFWFDIFKGMAIRLSSFKKIKIPYTFIEKYDLQIWWLRNKIYDPMIMENIVK